MPNVFVMERSTLDALRSARHELGPLRWVALYMVVAAVIGTVAVLSNLEPIERAVPGSPLGAFVAVAAGVAVVTATASVIPSACAFVAGWCLGGEAGAAAAIVGAGLGALLLQRVVAPCLGRTLFAFMVERPRAVAVRRFCGDRTAEAIFGVARLQWAAVMPLPVTRLLFAVVRTPSLGVLVGSFVAAVPQALFFAIVGEGARAWRSDQRWPNAASWIAAGAAALGAVVLRRAARRQWRGATGVTPP